MRKFFMGLAGALAFLTVLPVQAKDLDIAAFEGVWRGSAVSESNISSQFRVSARDLDVEIRSLGRDVFTIRWATILRQKGDPNAPVEVLKETTVGFKPDPTRHNVWRASQTADPMSGAPLYWARIKDQTLTVYGLGIAEDGTAELQIYNRTLGGLGMELDFTRTVDGEPVRSASGRLIKFAE